MKSLFYIIVSVFILLGACKDSNPDYFNIRGFAQGTTYSIIYNSECGIDPSQMKRDIDTVLHYFDLSLSTYNAASIISELNRGRQVAADSLLLFVLDRSREIWASTDGAFDITMGPLINAWGFGPDAIRKFKPEMLDSLMAFIGMDKLVVEDMIVSKSDPRMFIDLNAIAQGYSVDIICDYLKSIGVKRCLVEIGGEIRTVGSKYDELPWKVAIDKPIDNNFIPGANIQAVVRLNDLSLATSGNYRKFYVGDDGVKYSHTIDPRSGKPVQHNLLSATIVTYDCISADAYATACMVMGLEKAKALIESLDKLEGYLVYSDENGEIRTWFTDKMLEYLE